jgi:hypothetical protein
MFNIATWIWYFIYKVSLWIVSVKTVRTMQHKCQQIQLWKYVHVQFQWHIGEAMTAVSNVCALFNVKKYGF